MTQTTPIYDIAYADTGDPSSLQTITATMAASVEAALVDIMGTTPVNNPGDLPPTGNRNGQPIWVNSAGTNYYWDGSAWVPSYSLTTPWQALSLQNGWGIFGGGYQIPQYRKQGDMVQVRGVLSIGTTTSGTVITTLPAGFRIPAIMQFVSVANGYARVEVHPDGTIRTANPSPVGSIALAIQYSTSV